MSENAITAEAEVPVTEAPTDTPAPETPGGPRVQLEEAARQSGWAPKDKWEGKDEDWLDAPEFILKAVGEVLPSMRQSLKDSKAEVAQLRKTLKDFGEHHSKTEQRAYERAARDIQERLDQAAASGDVQGVRDATAELVDLNKEAQTAPKPADPATDEHYEAWVEANSSWFQKDKAMTAATVAIANEVEAELGLTTGKRFYAEVTQRVKEAFPHKFTNPNRAAPAAVEGHTPPRPRGKSFSDLPADAQAMCAQFERDIKGFKREQYVKDYFAQ